MKDFHIITYVPIDGIPPYTDSQLRALYDRVISEEKDYVFYDGTITSSDDFIRMVKSEGTTLYVIYHTTTLVLMVWLNRLEGAIARINWCSFDDASTRTKIKAGRFFNKVITDRVFDLLIGYTPLSNEKAIKFIKLCGGKIVGEVPNLIWNEDKGESEDGIISYYERGSDENI